MKLEHENQSLEYKKSTSEMKEALASIASMLNKNGFGTIYFGVKPNGEILGQEASEKTLRDISQNIANGIRPQIVPKIEKVNIENKTIIRVEVNGTDKPYSALGLYYIRTADEDRLMHPNQLKNLFNITSDSITIEPSSNQNLTFDGLKQIYLSKGLTINKNFEKNLNFYNSSDKYNYMAEILSDQADISIKIVTFNGTDKTEIIKRNEYGYKCLLLAMDEVLKYMEIINDTYVKLGSGARIEQKSFDGECFREAWINACLHTLWSTHVPPAVYIFSDRIEIISSGGLRTDMSKEEFFEGVSKPVNEKLQRIFGQLGYIEQTGHGVPLIIQKYGKEAFKIHENSINVIIPLFTGFNKDNSIDNNLNENERKVYDYIKNNKNIKTQNIEKEFNLSNSYVRKILYKLKENNLITRIGSKKIGYYTSL